MNSRSLISFKLILLISLLLLSCGKQKNISEYFKVKKGDFTNIITVSGYLESAKSVSVNCPRLFSDLTVLYLIPEGSYVRKGDTVCILDAPEIENRYLSSQKELEIAQLEYTKANESLKLQYLLLHSQVRTIEATAKITSLDSLQEAYSSPSQRKITQLEIQKAEIQKEKIQNKLHFLKKINKSELKKLELKIGQSRNNVNRAKDALNKLIITSSVDGIIQYAYNRATRKKITEGDVIWGNRPILNIPDLNKKRAHIVVNESTYKRISVENKVIFRIDAFPEINYTGKIQRKSPVGKPIERGSNIKLFDIYATIDSVSTEVKPGMSLTCQVICHQFKDTIAIPLTSIFGDDSSHYVYKQQKRKMVKQKIEIGTQSNTHAIVSSGLNIDDKIALIAP